MWRAVIAPIHMYAGIKGGNRQRAGIFYGPAHADMMQAPPAKRKAKVGTDISMLLMAHS
jgi:hypothetical protein